MPACPLPFEAEIGAGTARQVLTGAALIMQTTERDECVPSSHSSSFWYGLVLGVVVLPLAALTIWLLSRRPVPSVQLPSPLPDPATLMAARLATIAAGFGGGLGPTDGGSGAGPMTLQEQVGLHAPCGHSDTSSMTSPEATHERETRIQGARGCSSFTHATGRGDSTPTALLVIFPMDSDFGEEVVGLPGDDEVFPEEWLEEGV